MAQDKTLVPDWECVTDTVMGGVSRARLSDDVLAGRRATRLTGEVSLDNDGGFVQMAFDLAPDGGRFDASAWDGVALEVFGNAETYELRLRTTALDRPWQSFRATFEATETWRWVTLPFASFAPHRTDAAFDPSELRRMGVLAIGREFRADIAVASVRLVSL